MSASDHYGAAPFKDADPLTQPFQEPPRKVPDRVEFSRVNAGRTLPGVPVLHSRACTTLRFHFQGVDSKGLQGVGLQGVVFKGSESLNTVFKGSESLNTDA